MFCGNCGKEIANDAKFCPYCGSSMDNKDKGHIDEEKVVPINQDSKESIQNMAESFKNKPWNTWQNALILLVVFFVIISIFSPDKKTKGGSEQTTETTQESLPESVDQEKNTNKTDNGQLITITSGQLLREFQNNELRANDEYKDKKIKINGIVSLIGEQDGLAAIVLSGDNAYSLNGVQCDFENSKESAKVKNVNKGDAITVIGTVNSFMEIDESRLRKNVRVTECVLAN